MSDDLREFVAFSNFHILAFFLGMSKSAGFKYFNQLPQDLVIPPSVAPLGQCSLAPWQNMLEVNVGGIAERAAHFIVETHREISGAGQGVIDPVQTWN